MFSSMFTGASTPEVAPGDYYDYDFIHETNDSDFLSEFLFPNSICPEMEGSMKCQISKFCLHYIYIPNEGRSEVNSDRYEGDMGSTGSSLDMLHVEDEGEPSENEEGSGEERNPEKSSRDECMDRLKSGRRVNFRPKV